MNLLTAILSIIATASSALLVLTILLQAPRGGGAGGLLGAGIDGTVIRGARAADRFVAGVASLWIATCLALAVLA